MTTVGVYLQTMRKGRGFSQAKLAEAIGTTENTIWRIESGNQEPSASLLLKFVDAVRGNADHLRQLMTDTSATIEQARALAQRWLNPEAVIFDDAQEAELRRTATERGSDRVRRAVAELNQLSPEELVEVFLEIQTGRRRDDP